MEFDQKTIDTLNENGIHMRYIFLLLIAFSLLSCSDSNNSSKSYKVDYKGALKNIMHHNDLGAKANLLDYQNDTHLYGLGALENLKGEILLMNSRPYISISNEDDLIVDETFDHKATLFVYTSVRDWKSISLPDGIAGPKELEDFIERAAEENGINTSEPFPFLLDGMALSLDWHVINWPDGDDQHTHEKHLNSGINESIQNKEVEVLGFYSKKHHAIFTHHSTNMHMHVKSSDNEICGHLDHIIPGSNMLLKLPL